MTADDATTPMELDDLTSPSVLLGTDDVREFAELVKAETGVDLSAQEAWDRAIELIALVRMLLSPLPEDPDTAGRPSSNVAALDTTTTKTVV